MKFRHPCEGLTEFGAEAPQVVKLLKYTLSICSSEILSKIRDVARVKGNMEEALTRILLVETRNW